MYSNPAQAIPPHTVRPHRWVRTAIDPDEHADNLSHWDQSYNQFSSGCFLGHVAERWFPQLQLFFETANQTLHQSCAAWPDAIWFGLPRPNAAPASLDACPIPPDTLLFRAGGQQFELNTPAGFGIFGVVVGRDSLQTHLDSIEDLDPGLLERPGALHLPSPHYRALIHLLENALLTPHGSSPPHETPDTALPEQVLGVLGAALSHSQPTPTHTANARQNQRLVTQTREWVMAHPEHRLSVADLCRHLHVSRRSLQYAFQNVVGISPLSYLRMLKLNQVRRRLQTLEPPAGQVTQVATTWGFEHLGQFSRDYRALFGELPSATLRRPHG